MKYELRELGLTDNEIKVYLALVELGEATATPIRVKSGAHQSRVYEALTSLMEKGLVSHFMKNNIKHFKAQDPDVMYDILEEKKDLLKKVIPEIELLKLKEKESYSVSLHEGYKAVKQLYDFNLFHTNGNEEILVLGAQSESAHFLSKTFFKEFTSRRIKKGLMMRMLFYNYASATAKEYSNMKLTKVRMLPKDTASIAAMNIYPNSVTILLLKEKPVAFQINCKEVADSYRAYFDSLWNMSAKA